MSTLTPRPIKDYCLGIYDGPHATPEESDEGPIFLGIKNITDDGRIDLSDVRHVSENQFPKWTRRVTPTAGDVVFTYEATLHRYAVIPTDFRGCLGRRVALVRPNTSLVDSRYLLYYFLSSAWRCVIEGNVMSGATVDRIPLERFPEFPVVLPGLEVQKRVVAVLSNYDDLIENNRRRMALLEDSARQLYREWFVRLRFPGHEHTPIVDGVPQGWKKVRVDELGTVLTGKTPSTKDADNYGGDIQFVKTPDMHGNAFVLQTETQLTEKGAKSQANKFLPPGALLVSCIGTVGVVSLTSELCQFNQQINAVIPMEDFLRYYSYFALKDLKPRLDAIGGGVTMANVSKGKFESMDVLRPTSALLRNFDEFSSPVFNQIKVFGQQNQKLRQARDLLLPRLMNGELAV